MIWYYSLRPSDTAKTIHFHLYDTVYDQCTYEGDDKHSSRRHRLQRNGTQQMSLIQTCREVYQEAVQYLYEDSKFTLVLLAGLARPKDSLKTKHCIGRLESCQDLFGRMRHVTIVIQPGRKPKTSKFTARIAVLLKLIDYGRHFSHFCLQFNWHWAMSDCDPEDKRRREIYEACHPLREALMVRRNAIVKISTDRDTRGLLSIDSVASAGLGKVNLLPWHQDFVSSICKDNVLAAKCLERGAFSDRSVEPDQSSSGERTTVARWALILLSTPVTIPWAVGETLLRKKYKGEW